jgi:hypothetical protein
MNLYKNPLIPNTGLFHIEGLPVDKKSLLSAFLGVILIGGLFLASTMPFGTVQASTFTVDSISKPSAPEFSVRIVAYPYDVPPETTTIIDEYTGKETTITQPGYHVENKSIEITIKNQPFTPYDLTKYTVYYRDRDNFSRITGSYTYDGSKTVNFYYNIEVKGYYGDNWKSVGTKYSSYSEGPEPNAQLDSPYTVISIAADYPEDTVLDFRVKARIGYYYPYGPGVQILGYDFYGQESDWSSTQTITIGESQTTPAPTPTPPNDGSTAPPTQEPALKQDQITPIAGAAIVAAVIGVALGLLVYIIKRK